MGKMSFSLPVGRAGGGGGGDGWEGSVLLINLWMMFACLFIMAPGRVLITEWSAGWHSLTCLHEDAALVPEDLRLAPQVGVSDLLVGTGAGPRDRAVLYHRGSRMMLSR